MTVSLRGHDNSNRLRQPTCNRVRRSMSSSESRRREVTEHMWYAAEDCSRSVQRRLEKLGRRRLRVGFGEQTVHETKRNADSFETPTLLDDEVWKPGSADGVCPRRPLVTEVQHWAKTAQTDHVTFRPWPLTLKVMAPVADPPSVTKFEVRRPYRSEDMAHDVCQH